MSVNFHKNYQDLILKTESSNCDCDFSFIVQHTWQWWLRCEGRNSSSWINSLAELQWAMWCMRTNQRGEALTQFCFSSAKHSTMHGTLLPWEKNIPMSLFPHYHLNRQDWEITVHGVLPKESSEGEDASLTCTFQPLDFRWRQKRERNRNQKVPNMYPKFLFSRLRLISGNKLYNKYG